MTVHQLQYTAPEKINVNLPICWTLNSPFLLSISQDLFLSCQASLTRHKCPYPPHNFNIILLHEKISISAIRIPPSFIDECLQEIIQILYLSICPLMSNSMKQKLQNLTGLPLAPSPPFGPCSQPQCPSRESVESRLETREKGDVSNQVLYSTRNYTVVQSYTYL